MADNVPVPTETKHAAVEYKGEITRAWLRSQWSALKNALCQGAEDGEVQMLVAVAESLNLNPFSKEVMYVKAFRAVVLGWTGVVKLAKRDPSYAGMHADVVCANDVFERGFADGQPYIKHIPNDKDRGVMVGAYCRVWVKSFPHPIDVYVATDNVRQQGEGWKNFPHDMMRKSAVVRALRLSGLSPQIPVEGATDDEIAVYEVEAEERRDEGRRELRSTMGVGDAPDEKAAIIAAIEDAENVLSEARYDGWDVKPRRLSSRKKRLRTTTLPDATLLALQEYHGHLQDKITQMRGEADKPEQIADDEPALDLTPPDIEDDDAQEVTP